MPLFCRTPACTSLSSTFFLFFHEVVIYGVYVTLFVIFRPYKVSVYNKTDVALLITLLFAVFMYYSSARSSYDAISAPLLFTPCICGPLLYLVIWSAVHIKHIITHRTWCRKHTQETNRLLPQVEGN